MRIARQSVAASRSASVLKHEVGMHAVTMGKYIPRIVEGPGVDATYSRFHFRMRNAQRSEAASTAARVHKHEVLTCRHGGHKYLAYLGGSGILPRLSVVGRSD